MLQKLTRALEEGTKYSAYSPCLAHPGRRQHSKWYKITRTIPLSGVFSDATGCVPEQSHLLAALFLPDSSPVPFGTGTVQGGTEPNGQDMRYMMLSSPLPITEGEQLYSYFRLAIILQLVSDLNHYYYDSIYLFQFHHTIQEFLKF